MISSQDGTDERRPRGFFLPARERERGSSAAGSAAAGSGVGGVAVGSGWEGWADTAG
jgi:hypothetical protein